MTTMTPGVWQYLSEDIRPQRAKNMFHSLEIFFKGFGTII